MFDLSALVLASLAAFGFGILACLSLLIAIGRWQDRAAAKSLRASAARPPSVEVRVRHDVHHHGLPAEDNSGDGWKN